MLADAIASALPELRAEALERMRTDCVARPVTRTHTDAEGREVPTYGAAVYDGVCRLRRRGANAAEVIASADTVSRSGLEWHIPWDAPRVPVGAVVFVEGEPRYRVIGPADGDDLTACRYPVEVVT